MTLRELKLSIQEKDVPDTFFVFLCPPNDYFLASSYINAICEAKQLEKTFEDSIFSQDSALSLVMGFENNFRVIITDTFSEASTDYSRFVNTAVLCSKLDKKVEKALADYVIEIPKLVDWQLKDYIKLCCTGLTESVISEIYEATKGNLYMLDNLLAKVELFEAADRNAIAFQLTREPGTHKFDIDLYTFVGYLLANNKDKIKEQLLACKLDKNDFLGVVGNAISKLKTTLFIEYSDKSFAELGISEKQYYYLKKNPSGLSLSALQQKLKVLSSLDLQLKSGLLDLSNSKQLDYLIVKLVM